MVLISTPKRDDEVDGPQGRKPAPKPKSKPTSASPRTPAEDEHWSGGQGPSAAEVQAARLRMDEALARIRGSQQAAAAARVTSAAPTTQGRSRFVDASDPLVDNYVRMQRDAHPEVYDAPQNPRPGSAPRITPSRGVQHRIAKAWNDARPSVEKYLNATRAERAQPRDTTERKLKAPEFSKMSNNQRAAVLFNTELVRAIKKDELADDSNNSTTRQFLRDLGLTDTVADISEYMSLQNAVNDVDLVRLDDKGALRDSAASKRYEAGMFGISNADRFLNARGAATAAAGKIGDAIASKGQLTLRPNSKVKPLVGMGTTPNDETIRHVYGLMVDKQNDYSPEDIAEGIAALNAANGTTITPQDVWDFAAAQMQAAEYADIKNEGRVRTDEGGVFTNKEGVELMTRKRGAKTKDAKMPDLALLDKDGSPIVARSLAEIRKKYGI